MRRKVYSRLVTRIYIRICTFIDLIEFAQGRSLNFRFASFNLGNEIWRDLARCELIIGPARGVIAENEQFSQVLGHYAIIQFRATDRPAFDINLIAPLIRAISMIAAGPRDDIHRVR